MTAVAGTALSWHTDLDERTAAQVRALLDAATAADHTAPISEGALLTARSGGDQLLARATDGGEIVGYAVLDRRDPAEAVGELAVHPDHRRRGVGTTLVGELAAHAGDTTLRLWAHGEHPGALRLAEKLGFRQVRALWQMRRGLTEPELPEVPPLPDGVRIRTFVVGEDEAEFLRVNNAAFAWHPEQGGWGIEQVQEREREPWFDPAGFFLAVDDDDRLLGYHWTKIHTTPERIGEVYVVGVDPAEHGRKLGAILTLVGLRHLRDRDLGAVMLYVESDNVPAVKVYQRLGFTRWHTDAAFVR